METGDCADNKLNLFIFLWKEKEEGEAETEKKWKDFDNRSFVFEKLFSSLSARRFAASLISKDS